MQLTYIIAPSARWETCWIAIAQLERLAQRGHDVCLFLMTEGAGGPPPFEFPVRQFTVNQAATMIEALRKRPGLRVATNWQSAQLASEIDDDCTLFLTTDFETKLAAGYPEARAVIDAYKLGLPMITTSEWAQHQLKRVLRRDIPLAPAGVDLEQYHPREGEKHPGQVAYLASSDPIFGLEVFVEAAKIAFAEEPSIRMAVAGDAGKFGVVPYTRVREVNDDGIAQLLSSSACYVSSSHHETTASTQLEAMACGCPVVATRASGNEPFCEDGVNCLLVPKRDPEALAEAIVRVVRDEALRASLVANGLETATRYDWSRGIDALEVLLEEALQQAAPRPVPVHTVEPIDGRVSVVIPTKNGGSEFRILLQKLRSSTSADLEFLVIDSGSTDSTLTDAAAFGATIIEIDPDEFNHGETRNRAAEVATGDYLLFLTQDVLPAGDRWLERLLTPLRDGRDVAATTCREVPRSDADLFACWGIWNHHNGLRWHGDKITSADGANDPGALRASAQLTTNCLAIRRSLFERYRFKPVTIGEDLDLGVRLLQDGHRLEFLYSVGVIHSHARSAGYIIKRYYVDSKVVPHLLGSPPTMHMPVDLAVWGARDLYARVDRAISESADVAARSLFANVAKAAWEMGPSPLVAGGPLFDLFAAWPDSEMRGESENPFVAGFEGTLALISSYIDASSLVVDDRRDEIVEALYKACAASIGGALGTLVASDRLLLDDPRIASIDRLLSGGV